MSRKHSLFTLIALIVAMLIPFNASAQTQSAHIFVAQYDGSTGNYTGAVYTADDTYTAILWYLTDRTIESHEDDINPDQANYITVDNFSLESPTFDHNGKNWSWMYIDSNVTISSATNRGDYYDGLIAGKYAQFNGVVTDGNVALLRLGNPNVATNALGYFVQNGNIISYAAGSEDEDPIVPVTHKIMIPLIML